MQVKFSIDEKKEILLSLTLVIPNIEFFIW